MSTTIRLHSGGLLSKWGFSDGDLLDEPLWDRAHAEGIDNTGLSEHTTLIWAVRTYLLPLIEQRVEVYEISTIHNPIRAETVDGVEVDGYGPAQFTLTPEYVDVPLEAIWQHYLTTHPNA